MLLAVSITGCTPSGNGGVEAAEVPSNIIFLIGDGMGLSAVSTAIYFGEGPSEFQRFRHIGLINTSSATHRVTDSGAGGTALSSGKKT